MHDIEFTVERGKLWMLQTRSGKRTAKAALKMAVNIVGEGLIDEPTAIRRIDPMALDRLLGRDPARRRYGRTPGRARRAGDPRSN